MLLNKLLINIIFEIGIRLSFGHLFHQFIHFDGQLFLDTLDELLISGDIWIILQLSAQYSSGVLKVLGNNLNLIFSFLQLSLLGNACELPSSHHELSISCL